MDEMRKTVLLILHCLLPVLVYAQSADEIAIAKSMARSYGYSDTEINAALNHNYSGLQTMVDAVPVSSVVPADAGSPEVTVIVPAEADTKTDKTGSVDSEIYGHSYLTSSGLSIIPSYNAPVPAAYVLGPGDEVVIDIWGATVSHVAAAIGNDGSISVADLGPVYISGMTLSSAENFLKEELSRIYSGLSGDRADTFMRLSIGKIKGVSINVSGEVTTPGLYSVPSLATIPSVIFMAGGVNDKGSVRNITLYRHGQKVADFDLYDFLFKGQFNENLRIQDGDVLNVGAYNNVVSIKGAVMRPMRYEIAEGETIKDLLLYADGFDINAQTTEAYVHRRDAAGNGSFDVKESDFPTFRLRNGDDVSVRYYTSNDINSVRILGPVKYPGPYSIGVKTKDLASLIETAGGLMDGVYMEGGFIKRIDENRLPVSITFNLSDVLSGDTVIYLEREDEITLYSKSDLVEQRTVTIEGHVQHPGTFTFSDGMTVADLILQAYGVREDAYAARGQIRRISPDGSYIFIAFNVNDAVSGKNNILLERDDIVRIYSVRELREEASVTIGGMVNKAGTYRYYDGMTLEDVVLTAGGFANGADMRNIQIASRGGRERGNVEIVNIEEDYSNLNRQILPYDVVSVRRLTYFRSQITINVNGEVISPGPYSFDEAEVRLSEVMSRVGGFTDAAYPHGAKLTRVLTDEERERQKLAVMIANQNLGSDVVIDTMQLSDRFYIGIDIEEAIANPGSVSDVTLRDGDIIEIPIINNTVKISGGVFYPNTVAFDTSIGWKGYIRQAGGFTKLARKKKTYAVYMNGKVAVGNQIKSEPGMELIVPERKETEQHPLTPVEIASLASSTTSVATMVVSLIKLFM